MPDVGTETKPTWPTRCQKSLLAIFVSWLEGRG